MFVVTLLRAVGAFLAALPDAFAEAHRLRREFYRNHPFAAED